MRARSGIVALPVVALVLAGCGGGAPSGNGAATTTGSAPPSGPRPTGPATVGANVRVGEKPPSAPPVAQTHTAAGARSFAAYFIRAVDWGMATTDPSLIARASAPGCRACQAYVQSLTAMAAHGDSLRGARLQVVSATVVSGRLRVAADYGVDLVVNQQPAVAVPAGSSAAAVEGRGGQDYSRVYLNWTGQGWRVVEQTER